MNDDVRMQDHDLDDGTSLDGATPLDETSVGEVGDVIGDVDSDADGDAGSGAGGAGPAVSIDLEARAAADPRSRTELIAEIDGVEAQRDEYLDDLRRSHADFDNYRKRVARDGALQREQGRGDVVTALLDVLDDLDRVVVAAGALDVEEAAAETAAVTSGVQVVADKARRALEGLGVERVDAVGVPFDPTVHDAVQQVEREDGEEGDAGAEGPTVYEVLRPGYRLSDRVLRPAMVTVAQ